MSDREQARHMLRQLLSVRDSAPWVFAWFVQMSEKNNSWMGPRNLIQRMGGMQT